MEMNKLNPLFSLRSSRQHKAWGVSPRNHATESTKPVKWATAVSDSLLMTANASPLSPASRARVPGGVYPGANTPGFMLSPAYAGWLSDTQLQRE